MSKNSYLLASLLQKSQERIHSNSFDSNKEEGYLIDILTETEELKELIYQIHNFRNKIIRRIIKR